MWMVLKVLYRFLARLLRQLGRGAWLVPVAMLSMLLFGINPWTVAVVAGAVMVAVRLPVLAANLLPAALVILGICGLVLVATGSGATASWVVAAPAFWLLPRSLPQAKLQIAVGKVVQGLGGGPAHTKVYVPPPGARFPGIPGLPKAAILHQRIGAAWQMTLKGAPPPARLPKPLHPALYGDRPPPSGKVVAFMMHGGGRFPGIVTFQAAGVRGGLLLPLALLLLTLGLLLTPRVLAGLRGHVTAVLPGLRRRMLENRWGILLIPVAIIGLSVFGVHPWTVAAAAVAPAVLIWWPALAADLVPVLLAAFAVRGFSIAAHWQALPIPAHLPATLYGAILVSSRQLALLAGGEACLFLAAAAWLVPRTIGAHARGMLTPGPDPELAGRVQRLTETRDHAVDAATTELRRIERDLHDGAQARLVALGMNLRAVERLLPSRPQAALALVAEARETSLRALNDLRSLVRGIYPPVLADRGLGHAVRALALDTPLPAELDIDLPGRLTAPVESACYFAVAEALANAVKHAGARRVHIRIRHAEGMLRIEVADDGAGGADPAQGSGLRGIERRLGTFDGILAVSSPAGGPTMIVMEVPCALLSPKTCSC
jgi:signal transduction histidine kinase